MSTFLAADDAAGSAPQALCGQTDAFFLLASQSCSAIAGVVPPQVTFHRGDYAWLALSLSAYDGSDPLASTSDAVYHGMHTLTWEAMHSTVRHAIAAGFYVARPTDVETAVKAGLHWGMTRQSSLRPLKDADFVLLPAVPRPAPPRPAIPWWRHIPVSAWVVDGLLHALCHAIGFAGRFWDAPSRS